MNNFLIIPEIKETIKVKVALGMPAGAPITAVKKKKKEKKNTPPLVAEKTIEGLSMLSSAATYLLYFLLFNFFCFIFG